MKKLLAGLFLAATLCVGLAACSPDGTQSGNSVAETLDTREGFYAYSALSVGGIIDAVNGGTDESAGSTQSGTDGTVTDSASGAQDNTGNTGNTGGTADVTDEELAIVNKYLTLAESLMAESNISSTVVASDRAEYDWKNVVSYTDLAGDAVSYTVYYSEELAASEQDEDELEEIYRIRGVLIVDGAEYPVEGVKSTETESERGEEERESETWFRADLGNGDYIRIEQESESERGESEQELVYTVRMNGETEQTTLELEEERGEREVKMTVRKNGQTDVFEFEEEERGNGRVIRINASVGGENTSILVRVTTDENGEEVYRYEFGNGYRDFGRHDD